MVKIYDCRRKEILTTRRVSGDVEVAFIDNKGNTIFSSWFQMKAPHERTYRRIETLLEEMKKCLKRQEDESN